VREHELVRRTGGAIRTRWHGRAGAIGTLCTTALALIISIGPHDAAAQTARATVAGLVVDSLGVPVAGAQVAVEGTTLLTTTDDAGRFRLTDVAVGKRALVVRRIGFRAQSIAIDLGHAGATHLMVTLSIAPELLTPVEVTAPAEVYDARLAGFESRAAKRKNGHFISRERIDRSNSKRLSDLLRQVPTVRIAMVRGLGTVAFVRGASCPAVVYIDGSPASAGPLDLDLIDLSWVEGIEVYGGFGAPPEFSNVRGDRCGVIAIWSRPFRPRPRPVAAAPPSVISMLLEANLVFPPEAVDSAARPVGLIATVYPDSLLRDLVGGTVTARFIVDTVGLVEMPTVEMSATHHLFARAARAALQEARFSAAILDGRRVRQVVVLPFRFTPPGDPRLPR
jgi:TonB family protein